jgi:hypothetical protein
VSLFWVGDACEAHQTLSRAIARWNDRQQHSLDPEQRLFSAEWRVWSGVDVDGHDR